MKLSQFLFVFSPIYSLVTIILLVQYYDRAFEVEPVIPDTGKSIAQFTVAYNMCSILTLLIVTGLIGAKELNYDKHYHCLILFWLLTLYLSAAFMLSSFFLHCHYDNCFNVQTPLYASVLLGMITFVMAGCISCFKY